MTGRGAWMWTRVTAFRTTRVATTVRDGPRVVLWVPHLTAETVVGFSLFACVLAERAPEGLPSTAFLCLCPLLDAVQVENAVALLTGPDSRLMLDDIEAAGTVVLSADQLLRH